jgi:Zn-dependent protease
MFQGVQTIEIIARLIALVPAFTFHEFAHAWVANRLGDPTAKNLGRLTLNPLKHIDVFGILMVLTVGFGWARPVPFNPNNFRNGRKDIALVAVAGPMANLLFAMVLALVWRLFAPEGSELWNLVVLSSIRLNVALLFFNLIPIAPLDGFKAVAGWVPSRFYERWMGLARTGPYLLLGLIALSFIAPQLDVFGRLVLAPTLALTALLIGL